MLNVYNSHGFTCLFVGSTPQPKPTIQPRNHELDQKKKKQKTNKKTKNKNKNKNKNKKTKQNKIRRPYS